MKLINFLADRKSTIISYVLLMIFISLVIFIDQSFKMSIGNILYLNLVSAAFFIVYLTTRYLYFKRYYHDLNELVSNEKDNIYERLPSPKNNEQVLFHKVLSALYQEQSNKLQKENQQKKDYEEFITYWVHQVKTPISVGRLLIESNVHSPNRGILYSLEEELEKIDHYIEQALYYSKINDFSKDYLISDVYLDRLVKDAVKKQAKTFINKKIKIEMDNIDLIVTSDKKWLSFILDQLLSNSLKYTSSGGTIKIYGLVEDKLQKLMIEDNGIGIKTEDLVRVFERGFTGNNGRENYKSTGIGLYLSKKLGRKLGHDITIESSYGEYTKVTINFPKLIDYYQVIK